MSVQLYEYKEFVGVYNELLKIPKLENVIKNNTYIKNYYFSNIDGKNPLPPMLRFNFDNVLGRLLWYMYVANRVAYSLQYQENEDIFTPKETPENYNLEEARRKFGSFMYNIYTNNGTVFLSKDWLGLAKDIQYFLKNNKLEQGGELILGGATTLRDNGDIMQLGIANSDAVFKHGGAIHEMRKEKDVDIYEEQMAKGGEIDAFTMSMIKGNGDITELETKDAKIKMAKGGEIKNYEVSVRYLGSSPREYTVVKENLTKSSAKKLADKINKERKYNGKKVQFAITDVALPFEKGGKIGFDGLAKKVAKSYVGKKVPKKFQNQYGKTYSPAEAKEVGDKVAGAVYRMQQAKKMAKGGKIGVGSFVNYKAPNMDKSVKVKIKHILVDDESGKRSFVTNRGVISEEYTTYAKGGLTKKQQNQNLKAEKIRKNISLKAQEKYGLSNSEREAYENILFWAYDKQSQLKKVTNINIDDKDYIDYQKLQDKGLIVIGDDVTDDLVKVGLPSNFNKKLFAKGGKTQGYNDKLNESLGDTKGKRSTKEQNYKDRRNESEAMEKKEGKRKYSRVKTMDKGSRKLKKPNSFFAVVKRKQKKGEAWKDAIQRVKNEIKK